MKTSQALTDFIDILKTGNTEYGIKPHNAPELLDRWSIHMETQVNVISSKGRPTEIKGVFEDKNNPEIKFWNLRIPKNAATEQPTFEDKPLTWPPVVYAAGIGCTGWNWFNRTSRWVGFDFDAITGHAKGVGVEDAELDRVREAACGLPWVEVRRSTGGMGFHLYVLLDDIPTKTHTEHAALARCILGMMASEAGFDFASRIDACGGNMWVWHRKMTPENKGLELIKAAGCKIGDIDLPSNWRDHVDVVKRKRQKVGVAGVENEDKFDKLANVQQSVVLDRDHHAVLEVLKRLPYACEWVADHNCARIHTKALEEVKGELSIRGIYKTNSTGKDIHTPNAFMFPLPDGGWSVYRFSPGIVEEPTWEQDGKAWTTCRFNVDTDLHEAARACGGLLDGEKNSYHFAKAEDAAAALQMLGFTAPLSERMRERRSTLKVDKTGHVTIDITADKTDDEKSEDFRDWNRGKSRWYFTTTLTDSAPTREAMQSIDSIIMLTKTPQRQDAGWLIPVDGAWDWTSPTNAKISLLNHGFKKERLDHVLARAISKPWTLVNLPFQSERPGGRKLNFNAPQLRHRPAEVDEPVHPHWDMILDHCFQELNSVLPENKWAQDNNILTGRDYALAWLACMIREPFQPLPYIFMFGPENSGKSIFHEACKHVLITRGVESADTAFNEKFNGKLENTVLAYVEETNIAAAGPQVINKLKAWVTSPTIEIRKMRMDVYTIANTLHFVQSANQADACPVFDGDTRIEMMYVPKPTVDIPKAELLAHLEAEAPHFTQTILKLTLPSTAGRLRIPVVGTGSKSSAMNESRHPVLDYVGTYCVKSTNGRITCKEFTERFVEYCGNDGECLKRLYPTLRDKLGIVKGGKGKLELMGLSWKESSTVAEVTKSKPTAPSVSA